jgi:hypothetical protein
MTTIGQRDEKGTNPFLRFPSKIDYEMVKFN